ncbi:MAG: MFS transporter [Saprospiraceae bacterium]|nr:MFS transporter [Lewinella sp.]
MIARTVQLYRNAFNGLSRDIWLLSLVTFINRAGAMVIPFMTVYLTTQRSFSFREAGFVMSSFGVGSILGSLVGGRLTDRYGYYPVQFWTLLGSGFLFFVLMRLNTVAALCIGTFSLSLVADAFRPANQTAIAFYSRPENRARAFGLMRLAMNLGFSAGPVFGGLLASSLGYGWLFALDGTTCILAAVLFRLSLDPKGQRKLVEQQKEEQEATLPDRPAYQDLTYMFFLLMMVLGATAFIQFFNSLPVFLKQSYGFSEAQIGLLTTINGLMIVAIEMPLVYGMESRMTPLRAVAVGQVFFAIAFCVLAGGSYHLLAPAFFMIILTMGEMMAMPFASTYAAGRAHPNRRGQYLGLYSMSWGLALIIGPTAGLWLAETYGFITMWWGACLLNVVSMTGLLIIGRRKE